jgi:hypothetical protein
MMRSASTWSFNVCRLLADSYATLEGMPSFSDYIDYTDLDEFLRERITAAGISVIKVHSPGMLALQLIYSGEVKNICTIRDPRDCVVSMKEFQNESLSKAIEWIKANLYYVGHYRASGNTLFVRYEEMINNPIVKIEAIAKYLEIDTDKKLLAEIADKTNINNLKKISDDLETRPPETLLRDRGHLVDPLTQIHETHFQGGVCGRWRNELTRDEIRIVNDEFNSWLIELGYETDNSLDELISG